MYISAEGMHLCAIYTLSFLSEALHLKGVVLLWGFLCFCFVFWVRFGFVLFCFLCLCFFCWGLGSDVLLVMLIFIHISKKTCLGGWLVDYPCQCTIREK